MGKVNSWMARYRVAGFGLAAVVLVLVLADAPKALADTTSWTTSPVRVCGQSAITAGTNGNVYVHDLYSGMVQKYAGDGTYLGTVGPRADTLAGLVASPAGGVYVGYNRGAGSGYDIVKYDGAGNAVQTIHIPSGSLAGQASVISAIGTDSANDIYILDWYSSRVEKFSSSGAFVTQWGSAGSGNGQFDFYHAQGALGVAGDGTVYVADFSNRIQKFTPDGTFVTAWGSTGTSPGQFVGISSLAVDAAGHVYAAQQASSGPAIQEFDSSGNLLGSSTGGVGAVTTYGADLVYGYLCNTVVRFELTIPDVSLSLSATSVYVGQPLTATATASVPFGSITNYVFDFGTGGPATAGVSPNATSSYATAGSYRPAVQVTSSRGGTRTAEAMVTVKPRGPENVSPPTISGTALEGQRMTETHGSWKYGPITAYDHQWERCDRAGNVCSPIRGATAQTYVLTAADVGHTIRVMETATNAGGKGMPAATSRPTALVNAVAKLSALSVSPRTFRAARSGNSVTRSSKAGTSARYRLNIAASVRFTVQRALDGRLVGGRCQAPSRKNRKAPRCTRYSVVPGAFTVGGRAGENTFRFSGRFNGRKLAPGTYRLTATPIADNRGGSVQTTSFAILR
ncbi:MAG TPA: PKD domain-containing protein [Pseudonocardiaceae bacterium]|nr:PKD domain-containing protein [Pseudonocardiaceae bacterium]